MPEVSYKIAAPADELAVGRGKKGGMGEGETGVAQRG